MIYTSVKLILLSLFVFLFGCHSQPQQMDRAPYEDYYEEVVGDFAREMKATYNLRCIGEGGQMPYDIEGIELGFMAYQRAIVEEARNLEVLVTEAFLQAINSHKKIRPYLREYPFPASRTNVTISFNKPDNRRYSDGSVAYMFHVKNTIFYSAKDPETGKYIDIHEEPYEEARRIVLGQQSP